MGIPSLMWRLPLPSGPPQNTHASDGVAPESGGFEQEGSFGFELAWFTVSSDL